MFMKRLRILLGMLLIFVCTGSLEAFYFLRYTTTDNGAITFTGNTLGLSKQPGQNQPGTSDAIGAFITTNASLFASPVGNYPNYGTPTTAGTTLNQTFNSSAAYLDLPSNSTILYADLIWSGSYSYGAVSTINDPDTKIVTLTTPQGNSFSFAPDLSAPGAHQNAITPEYGCPGPTPTPCVCPCGNYMRCANKTAPSVNPQKTLAEIIQAAGPGKYTVGGVPGTVVAVDDTHNAAGWTLAVVYQNPNMYTNNLTLFVGCEQASTAINPVEVSGFCVPPAGTASGRLYVSAIEADANKSGDQMLFGPTAGTLQALGVTTPAQGNNPLNNFFCSQLNTLLPLTTDANGKLIAAVPYSQLDTRGSYGTFNPNPFTSTNIPNGRQGYDITSVDITNTLVPNQTSAFALGTTTSDDYTINALAMEIRVEAPIVAATKKESLGTEVLVESLIASLGNIVTFTINIKNNEPPSTSSSDAIDVTFKDILEPGLTFVPGSFKYNNVTQLDPNLATTGFLIGNLAAGQVAPPIEFKVLIESYPLVGNQFHNAGTVEYAFIPCEGDQVSLLSQTNQVIIELPRYLGCFECHDDCRLYFVTTWDPVNSPDVIAYKIYRKGTLVATIPAQGPYEYSTCLKSSYQSNDFKLAVVKTGNRESVHIPVSVSMYCPTDTTHQK